MRWNAGSDIRSAGEQATSAAEESIFAAIYPIQDRVMTYLVPVEQEDNQIHINKHGIFRKRPCSSILSP
jgi:hypothetical protein